MNANAGLILSLGGIFIGVYSLVKEKSILGLILLGLLCGAVFETMGWLDLKGVLDSEWALVGVYAVVGIVGILTNISLLYSPPSPKAPRWTQWAGLVIGAVLVLLATLDGWIYYWH